MPHSGEQAVNYYKVDVVEDIRGGGRGTMLNIGVHSGGVVAATVVEVVGAARVCACACVCRYRKLIRTFRFFFFFSLVSFSPFNP